MRKEEAEYAIELNEYTQSYAYSCENCGPIFFNHDDASDYTYCPICGARIISHETLECTNCDYAEFDGDGYHCENKNGKHCGECVDDENFDGCVEYQPRDPQE